MSTDTMRATSAPGASRRTVAQLLALAAKDPDPVSTFGIGSDERDSEGAIFVVKRREHVDYLKAMMVRQGMLTPGAPVDRGPATPPPGPAPRTDDELLDTARKLVIEHRRASISLIQRHLRIGYNQAARLLEQLEHAGVVTPMSDKGHREVRT